MPPPIEKCDRRGDADGDDGDGGGGPAHQIAIAGMLMMMVVMAMLQIQHKNRLSNYCLQNAGDIRGVAEFGNIARCCFQWL